MRHSSGGESSSIDPSPMRMRRACSHRDLVAKGQTGALFLLGVDAEGMAWFLMGSLDIGRWEDEEGGGAFKADCWGPRRRKA